MPPFRIPVAARASSARYAIFHHSGLDAPAWQLRADQFPVDQFQFQRRVRYESCISAQHVAEPRLPPGRGRTAHDGNVFRVGPHRLRHARRTARVHTTPPCSPADPARVQSCRFSTDRRTTPCRTARDPRADTRAPPLTSIAPPSSALTEARALRSTFITFTCLYKTPRYALAVESETDCHAPHAPSSTLAGKGRHNDGVTRINIRSTPDSTPARDERVRWRRRKRFVETERNGNQALAPLKANGRPGQARRRAFGRADSRRGTIRDDTSMRRNTSAFVPTYSRIKAINSPCTHAPGNKSCDCSPLAGRNVTRTARLR